MNFTHIKENEPGRELLILLDAEVQNIEATLDHLNNLRANVIKRDESALTELLERITMQQEDREAVEDRRQRFQRSAADALGCRADQVNLTRFMEHVSEEMRPKVAQRKAVLEQLIGKLKTEYAATALLLSECSRFNRLLLDSIFGSRGKGAMMYNASGQTQQHNGGGFITMQF